MTFNSIKASMFVASLLITSPSFSASLPSNTFTTVNDLKWLHYDKTAGKSYEYINGQFDIGGAYEGYRFATVAEVSKLLFFSPTFLTPGVSDHRFIGSRAEPFLNIFNIQVSPSTYSMSGFMQNQNFLEVIADFHPTEQYGDQSQYIFFPYTNFDYDQYKNITGAYLVSPVPIPAAVFMFAPALLGFIGWRCKAKKTVA